MISTKDIENQLPSRDSAPNNGDDSITGLLKRLTAHLLEGIADEVGREQWLVKLYTLGEEGGIYPGSISLRMVDLDNTLNKVPAAVSSKEKLDNPQEIQTRIKEAEKAIWKATSYHRTVLYLRQRVETLKAKAEATETLLESVPWVGVDRKLKTRVRNAVTELYHSLVTTSQYEDQAKNLPMSVRQPARDVLNKAQELFLNLEKRFPPDPAHAAYARYLEEVERENGRLDPKGIVQTVRSVTLPLERIYVALRAEQETKELKDFRRQREEETEEQYLMRMQEGEERPCRNMELHEAVRSWSHLVLLGDPGAGKTTLLRFVAYQFAKALRTEQDNVVDLQGREYGKTRFPILFRIADYAQEFESNLERFSVAEYLPTALYKTPGFQPELLPRVYKALKDGNALVLMDGLDEIAKPSLRGKIVAELMEFTRTFPKCQFIVSSRVVGYWAHPMTEAFEQATLTLQDMEQEQVEAFLQNWCREVERFHKPDDTQEQIDAAAQLQIDHLMRAYGNNDGVRRLAKNPLLLTILAIIQRAGTRLPDRRIELYDIATTTLLRDWWKAKGGADAEAIQPGEADYLLTGLAYKMHTEYSRGLISEKAMLETLVQTYQTYHGEPDSKKPLIEAKMQDFMRRVRERAGIIAERATGYYGFLHLTFQEYYAGKWLVEDAGEAANRLFERRKEPRWREPIRLAIAHSSGINMRRYLEKGLLDKPNFADLILATLCITDAKSPPNDLLKNVATQLCQGYLALNRRRANENDALYKETLEALNDCTQTEFCAFVTERLFEALPQAAPDRINRIYDALRRVVQPNQNPVWDFLYSHIQQPQGLTGEAAAWYLGIAARENAEIRLRLEKLPKKLSMRTAALALATPMSPPKQTVSLDKGIEFVTTPAGGFWQGSNELDREMPPRWVELKEYKISKYPVTVAQFRQFTQETGAQFDWNKRKPSWGWIDDHPMVDVRWDEARAYCQWVGGDLPTEAQWEKVARGTDGRTYPWGNDWEDGKHCANSMRPNKLKSTVAVGSYPTGVSPYGVHDMAGNVWEWCRDYYDRDYYKTAPRNNPVNLKEPGFRVVRGGSWNIVSTFRFRSAFRNVLDYRSYILGFRVVRQDS